MMMYSRGNTSLQPSENACHNSSFSPSSLKQIQTTFLIDNKKVFGTHLMQDMIKDALRYFVSPPVLSNK